MSVMLRTVNKQKAKTTMLFNGLGYSLITIVAVFAIFPIILLVSGSFTSETAISRYGYSIIPREFSLKAYEVVFQYPQDIIRSYAVTIMITAIGVAIGLLVVAMTAYVLSRKDFLYRNQLAFFFYFTTLFNGGLLSTYIFVVRHLNLKNSIWALILPILINVFYLLIMRSFMKSIPDSIVESAKIDGAGEIRIFMKLILPLATPGLATIGLFIALDYWNDWYNAMLYISDYRMYPLQYMLFAMLSATEAMSRISSAASIPMIDMPSQSLKLAMAVVAMGPIVLIYPFVQKYFVKGITLGAVKG